MSIHNRQKLLDSLKYFTHQVGSKVVEVTDRGVQAVGAKMDEAAPAVGRYVVHRTYCYLALDFDALRTCMLSSQAGRLIDRKRNTLLPIVIA